LSYITRTKATIGLSTGATYDWEGDALSLPVSLTVNQLLKVSRIPVQLGGGIRYRADSPAGGPSSWGYRAAAHPIQQR
jgi:hypothetical protein